MAWRTALLLGEARALRATAHARPPGPGLLLSAPHGVLREEGNSASENKPPCVRSGQRPVKTGPAHCQQQPNGDRGHSSPRLWRRLSLPSSLEGLEGALWLQTLKGSHGPFHPHPATVPGLDTPRRLLHHQAGAHPCRWALLQDGGFCCQGGEVALLLGRKPHEGHGTGSAQSRQERCSTFLCTLQL